MVTNAPLSRKFEDMYYKNSKSNKFSVMAPKYRMCPRCKSNIIENNENCKHTKCPCNSKNAIFCFICLAIYDVDKKSWPCGRPY